MDQPSRIAFLFSRYAIGACTDAERDEYLEMVKSGEYAEELQHLIEMAVEQAEAVESLTREEADRILQEIMHPVAAPVIPISGNRRNRRTWWAAAAVLVLLASGTLYYFLSRPSVPPSIAPDANLVSNNSVQPGGNKAVLTLGDNSSIILDSAGNGQLAQQGSSVVSKTKDGELRYQSAPGNQQLAMISYNTLSTPRGGEYQLVLPDGSKVWLNAASSIRFPVAFAGNERTVDITGEVYFEVSKDPKKPFRVQFTSAEKQGAVEVLGTHFNVNAYPDETSVKTTLLEGSVKVSQPAIPDGSGLAGNRQSTKDAERSVVLKPGEQAVLAAANSRFTIADSRLTIDHSPDLDQVMAWKNGQFHFENADIKAVMRQISRWYDVDVEFDKPNVKIDSLFIEFPRSFNLSDAFKVIESTSGVQLKMKGKKIIVL